MEIRVESLKIKPRKLTFVAPIAEFPLLRELAEQGEIEFCGDVSADLVATLVGTLVEVEGRLTCPVVLSCSRCLQRVEQLLELQVVLSFSRQKEPLPEAGEDAELTEDEVGLIPFEGETIDLRAFLAQELLIGLPQHPLCSDKCAGLCPVCGGDLNRERCDCVPPVFHGGFAALAKLKDNK